MYAVLEADVRPDPGSLDLDLRRSFVLAARTPDRRTSCQERVRLAGIFEFNAHERDLADLSSTIEAVV